MKASSTELFFFRHLRHADRFTEFGIQNERFGSSVGMRAGCLNVRLVGGF